MPADALPAPLLRSTLFEGGVGLVVAGALALGVGFATDQGMSFPLQAMGLVAALLLITFPALREHGLERFGPANRVTLLRAGLVGLLAGWIGAPMVPVGLAAAIGLAALALDGVDGVVARRTGSASAFGARLDMELDALTVVVLWILAWQLDKAGAWILLAGALRYIWVFAASPLPWLRRPLPPSDLRRAICGVQVGAASLCLALPAPWAHGLAALALLTLCWSFGRDALWCWRSR